MSHLKDFLGTASSMQLSLHWSYVFLFLHSLLIFFVIFMVFFETDYKRFIAWIRTIISRNKFIKRVVSSTDNDRYRLLVSRVADMFERDTAYRIRELLNATPKNDEDYEAYCEKMRDKNLEKFITFWENEMARHIFWVKVRLNLVNVVNFIVPDSFINFFRSHHRTSYAYSTYKTDGFFRKPNVNDYFNIGRQGSRAGLVSVWSGLHYWIIPLVVAGFSVYYLMVVRCLPFMKIVFVWIVVAMFAYWLLSGFVFFVKKYQFSKFTSAIQRFWRRSYILFWLIEFSLFSVFFYLTLNANNESWYMYDQLQVFKDGLFSWRAFLLNIFPLTLLIIMCYLLLLTLKWNIFTKQIPWMLILTLLLVYVVWTEFNQFFHVVNFYGNFNWIFDIDEKVWSLELENRKSRTVNHYIMLMIMLKFWHIIVIFLIWVFFILRVLEIGRIRYPLFSANFQNFIILYLFGWVLMFPWFKFIFRKYLDMPYYWFYVNNRRLGFRVLYNDVMSYYYGLSGFIKFSFLKLSNFFELSFFFFSSDDDMTYSGKSLLKVLTLSRLSFN